MGFPFFLINPPRWILLASIWIINSSLKLGYETNTFCTTIYFISTKCFFPMSVHANLNLAEHYLVWGALVYVSPCVICTYNNVQSAKPSGWDTNFLNVIYFIWEGSHLVFTNPEDEVLSFRLSKLWLFWVYF